MSKQVVVSRKSRLSVGQLFSCQYPVDGRKNILKNHVGVIQAITRGPNGTYVTLEETQGQFRNLLYKKMYRPKIVK